MEDNVLGHGHAWGSLSSRNSNERFVLWQNRGVETLHSGEHRLVGFRQAIELGEIKPRRVRKNF